MKTIYDKQNCRGALANANVKIHPTGNRITF